ncbi:MAG: lysophospholipid acyltransferase family protein [Rhodospirillales bacterium]
MAQRKKLLQRPWVQACLAVALAGYIRFLRLTTRWQVEAPEETRRLLEEGRGFVGCFSHSRIAMTYPAWPIAVRRLTVLTSSHRDGLLVARTVERLGAKTVSGSGSAPTKGGAEALEALREAAEGGEVIGITPDGPRGPFLRVKGGCVRVAQKAAIPIVPFALAQRRASYLKTWDRFVLPWPFSRGVLLFGEPVAVPMDRSLGSAEAARRAVEDSLIALTQEADRRCGRAVLPPGDDVGKRPKSRRPDPPPKPGT